MTPFRPTGRTHDQISREAVARFAAAMPEPLYLVSIRNDAADETLQLYRTFSQIEHSLRWMRRENATGCRIHGRPWSTRHILVDDVTFDTLDRLAALYTPACVVETSAGSLQAWVTVSAGHVAPALATEAARILAQRFGGDIGAAGARQPGAWPGFTNAKAAHLQPNGTYPFTRLVYADGPTITPNAYALLAEASVALASRLQTRPPRTPPTTALGGLHPASPATEMQEATRRVRSILPPGTPVDRSRRDVSIARRLIGRGAPASYVAAILLQSAKLAGADPRRTDDYVRRTIAAAQKAVSTRPQQGGSTA